MKKILLLLIPCLSSCSYFLGEDKKLNVSDVLAFPFKTAYSPLHLLGSTLDAAMEGSNYNSNDVSHFSGHSSPAQRNNNLPPIYEGASSQGLNYSSANRSSSNSSVGSSPVLSSITDRPFYFPNGVVVENGVQRQASQAEREAHQEELRIRRNAQEDRSAPR